MAEVKWIKIVTDIFDDEKMALIESMPEADSIIVIWFKLLCLAGKQNNNGVFMLNDKIAYTEEMLSTIFRRKPTTVNLALTTFEKFGMIEIVNNVITIPNWGKHQSLDAFERKRERDRIYQAEKRQRQKLLNASTDNRLTIDRQSTDASTDIVSLEEDIELDKNILSKKVSKKDVYKNQSYEELFDEMSESGFLEKCVYDKLWEFIKHLQANGITIINSRLNNIIIQLDLKYRTTEEQLEVIDKAIAKGHKALEFEV